VFKAVGVPLSLEEVDRPVPGRGDAILRVRACGICGSDLHASATEGRLRSGAILGHELAGEIVELGPDPIGNWKIGDRVFTLGNSTCGRCGPCRDDRSHFCDDLTPIGDLSAGDLPGAYAEFIRVGTNDLILLPEGIPFEVGALMEPLAVGMVSVRLAELQAGSRVLILGGGPVGLAIATVSRLLGARRIVVSEPVERRRQIAEALGATDTIDPEAAGDLGEAFRSRAGGEPDVVFEAIGRPGFLNLAVSLVRVQGMVIAAGVCPEPDPLDHRAAYKKEPTVRFPCYYTVADARFLTDVLEQGRFDPSPMITHRVTLAELPAALEALRRPRDQAKVMVLPATAKETTGLPRGPGRK
jgi:(R,R)-butanediol dehydrogenase/meso-butanediol dehydrogenase/diacetyl reductase